LEHASILNKKGEKNDGKDDFALGFGHIFRVGGAAGEPVA
jgi:hypothetical protein